MGDLGTANIFLGIMAVVSILEGLLIIGMGLGGYFLYRKVMELVQGLEQRQVAPAMARVNAILDDVKVVSTRVKDEADRVDNAIRTTIDRMDDTADRVRSNVRDKTSRIVGIMRGVRVAVESMLQSRAA